METLNLEYLRLYNKKELDLSNRKLSLDQIEALASNTTLRTLNLSGARIRIEGIEALSINTTLRKLDLFINQI